tara:strand:- start:34 stop:432 length:399 start_codon:yes stop_codon:yes gene_type:complete
MVIEDYFKIKGTYELVDGLYNVKGHVHLIKDVDKLPFKFGKVTSNFFCNYNKLKTLEGCPTRVGGNFDCDVNLLSSLEGSPIWVGGDFWCYGNNLKTLEGAPISIGGNFYCDANLHNTKEYRQHIIMKKLRK